MQGGTETPVVVPNEWMSRQCHSHTVCLQAPHAVRLKLFSRVSLYTHTHTQRHTHTHTHTHTHISAVPPSPPLKDYCSLESLCAHTHTHTPHTHTHYLNICVLVTFL